MTVLLKIPAKPTHEKLCELVSRSSFLIVAILNRAEESPNDFNYNKGAMRMSCLPEQLGLKIDYESALLPPASGVVFVRYVTLVRNTKGSVIHCNATRGCYFAFDVFRVRHNDRWR